MELHNQHVGLFFSNFHGGGIQRVMLSLADGLLQEGWRVDLILVQADGPLRDEIPHGCGLFDLQAGHATQSLFKLAAYLKSEKPKAILSSQTHLNVTAVMARILSRWKGRLLLSEHVALNFAALNPANWKDRFSPFLASIFYRGADGIILVSKETARHFLKATKLPKKMVRVIYNPIVSEKLIDQSKIHPDHIWFNMPNTPVFLAAGRLTPQKDFETLLRAFSLLHIQVPFAKLIVLGEGKERLRLERLSEELGLHNAVQFPGFVINPFTYMANASVFILSSRWEGFANVLVEAMACGTSVVSTDCPSGPSEILENGRFGTLTPVGNPQALADAILKTLYHPYPPAILSKRAMDFSMENILPQYLDILTPAIFPASKEP